MHPSACKELLPTVDDSSELGFFAQGYGELLGHLSAQLSILSEAPLRGPQNSGGFGSCE